MSGPTPKKKKTLLVELNVAPRSEASCKLNDVADLKTLAELLEQGVNPNPHDRFVKEPWAAILRRYLAGKYPRADKSTQTALIARHVWIRQALFPKEKLVVSAGVVAKALKGAALKNGTVLSVAKRKRNKGPARQWIARRLKQHRGQFTRESILQTLLEQFEPDAPRREVQRMADSLHPKLSAD